MCGGVPGQLRIEITPKGRPKGSWAEPVPEGPQKNALGTDESFQRLIARHVFSRRLALLGETVPPQDPHEISSSASKSKTPQGSNHPTVESGLTSHF